MFTPFRRIFIQDKYFITAMKESKIIWIIHAEILVDSWHIPNNYLTYFISIDWFSYSGGLSNSNFFINAKYWI